ncbi:MAG: replicative DNA helicase [Candidatus Omnitrophica bacterium]|nr:replicative DNA helicase [Candidatus Omnitrophota bacterium]
MADIPIDKVPPQNIEAEMAVLGSMLIDENAVALAVEMLDKDCFYKDTHKKIYEVILNLYNANRAIDVITVSDELKRLGILEEIGGVATLVELANSVPTSANVHHYARIVKEKSILRALINNATQIVNLSYESEGNVDEILDKAESLIFEISDNKKESSTVSLKEVVKDTIDTIDKLYQKKSYVTGIPTGFIDFDQRTAGFHPSDFIVIAGRPSMGKSAFAISIAEHVGVVEKIPLAFFSLEMSKEQLVQRMLCSHARVDVHKVRTGYLASSDWPRLTAAAGKLSEAPIFIEDTPAISIMELRAKARRLKSHYNIQLLILDYLQLMKGTGRAENRQQEISEISRSLKALARELHIPVVAISQLSRAVEARADHRPQLSDLRESGAIEQDADLVALLLREEYYNPTEENEGIAEVIIAKQRNGPVGSIKLAFTKEYARFENLIQRE